jgi:hypothetical protein
MKSLLKYASTSLVIIAFAMPANATGLDLRISGFVRHDGAVAPYNNRGGVPSLQFTAPAQRNTRNEPGYPTYGKAVDACGAGNVFVVYDEGGTLGRRNHRYDCAD